MIRASLDTLVASCLTLDPACGIVICHDRVYKAAAAPLRTAGVRVLHDESLPFPLGNWRARFAVGLRRAVAVCD